MYVHVFFIKGVCGIYAKGIVENTICFLRKEKIQGEVEDRAADLDQWWKDAKETNHKLFGKSDPKIFRKVVAWNFFCDAQSYFLGMYEEWTVAASLEEYTFFCSSIPSKEPSTGWRPPLVSSFAGVQEVWCLQVPDAGSWPISSG